MFHLVDYKDGRWAIEQEDGRLRGGRREVATGTEAEMVAMLEELKGSRKVIFRISRAADEALEDLKDQIRQDKQAMFSEAVDLWLGIAQDRELMARVEQLAAVAGVSWVQAVHGLVATWGSGELQWTPPNAPSSGGAAPDPWAITGEERATWREHMEDRDPHKVWAAVQFLGYTSPSDWAIAHSQTKLAGTMSPVVRSKVARLLGSYLTKSVLRPQ